MFTITNNGAAFYDPRLKDFPVEIPKLVREENSFDSLTFTLYPPHPAYNLLEKKSSILSLYLDSDLVAQFVPTYKRRVFNSGIEYKCKNIICFLDDFYYRELSYDGTASGFIDSIISGYNARVSNAYKIQKGNVHSASVKYETSEPKKYWQALKSITDQNGGYLAPRFSSGVIYLDYLQDSDLPLCTQKIAFGSNMTDLFIEKDTENCFSVLFPFGTDSDNNPVSIASVNNNVDYLENSSAVSSYGRREKMITWTNVESPSALLALAQPKLNEIAALFYESVQLSAVDLHNVDINIPALAFLNLIDCVSAPHGYTHRYPITYIEIPLDEPKSETIHLGSRPLSLTDRISLEREQNASARTSYGRAISKAEKDIVNHWQHVVNVTDQGMSDAFGIIGVSIGQDGMPVKDASGNYVWDDSGTGGEIWGHLNRSAWSTQILNHIKDSNGKIISLGEVYTDAYGNAIINAINDQRTGTATINANRIKLHATDSITLDALLSIQANTGYLQLTGTLLASGNVYSGGDMSTEGTLRIGSSVPGEQGSETGALYFRGTQFHSRRVVLGSLPPFLKAGRFLSDGTTDFNLNHTHAISMQEITSGEHAGEVQVTLGAAIDENDSGRIDFFDIAASQTYIAGVAAAAASGAASHNVSSIGGITLSQSDAGQVVTKNTTVTYSNGDTTSISQSLDLTGISAGADASQINLANQQDILWVDSGSEGRYQFTSLGHLGSLIMAHVNDRGYAMFYARIDGGTGEKLYGIPIG